MTRRPRRDDGGTVFLLTAAYCTLALALILGVIDVTVLYLARRDLQTVADGAALTAAQQLSAAGAYASARLDLDQGRVDAIVAEFHERYAAAGGATDIDWANSAATVTGDTVAVVLRRPVTVPFTAVFRRVGLRRVSYDVVVTARARLGCVGC